MGISTVFFKKLPTRPKMRSDALILKGFLGPLSQML